jgi:hypothetical protein
VFFLAKFQTLLNQEMAQIWYPRLTMFFLYLLLGGKCKDKDNPHSLGWLNWGSGSSFAYKLVSLFLHPKSHSNCHMEQGPIKLKINASDYWFMTR